MGDLPTGPGRRPERLTRRVDFQKAYRDGRRWNGRWVNLFVRARSAEDPGSQVRVGITITRKSGGAVRRNRIRRQIREILREIAPGLRRVEGKADLVVHVRPGDAEIGFESLRQEIRSLIERGLRGNNRERRGNSPPPPPGPRGNQPSETRR